MGWGLAGGYVHVCWGTWDAKDEAEALEVHSYMEFELY